MEKMLATKKQQSMSYYRFIVVSSSVTVLDHKMIICVSTLKHCPRCGSHTMVEICIETELSCLDHILRGRAIRLIRKGKIFLKFRMLDELGRK